MKKRLKQISKVLLLCSMLYFTSCVNDDYIENRNLQNENKISSRYINFNEVKDNWKVFDKFKNVEEKIKQTKSNSLNQNARLVYLSQFDFSIDTDQILLIEKEGYKSYTFPIYRDNEIDKTENLVITESNGFVNAYISKYNLTENDKASLENNQYVDLNGKTEISTLEARSSGEPCYDFVNVPVEWNEQGQVTFSMVFAVEVDCPNDGGSSGGGDSGGGDSGGGNPGFGWPGNWGNPGGDWGNPYNPGGNYPIGGGGPGGSTPGDPSNPGSNTTNPPNNGDNPVNQDPNLNDGSTIITSPVLTVNRTSAKLLSNLNDAQKNWWNNIASEDIKIKILNYLDQNNSNTESTQNVKDIIDEIITENNSVDSLKLASLTLNTLSNEVPWTPNTGFYNNIPSLHYTHTRTTSENGRPCYQYLLTNGDILANMDYASGWQDEDIRTLYYSKDAKNWFFIPKPTQTFVYNHTDLDFLFTAFWSTVQTGVRYCTPLEDAIILIDGKDFDGVASSRAVAGIFILVDFVPGAKVLKITKKAGYALSAASPVLKVVIDAITKSQKALKKQYKNVIDVASNSRKGVFGEICTDIDFVEKGYEVLHVNRKTAIDPIGNNTGIDHIFKNPVTGEFIIVESKYHGTGGLSTLTDGTRQMSDNWIKGTNDNILNNENRLWMALGQDTSLYNQVKSNYQRVIAYVQADGTINYKYITSQGYEINTHQGVFTN